MTPFCSGEWCEEDSEGINQHGGLWNASPFTDYLKDFFKKSIYVSDT